MRLPKEFIDVDLLSSVCEDKIWSYGLPFTAKRSKKRINRYRCLPLRIFANVDPTRRDAYDGDLVDSAGRASAESGEGKQGVTGAVDGSDKVGSRKDERRERVSGTDPGHENGKSRCERDCAGEERECLGIMAG